MTKLTKAKYPEKTSINLVIREEQGNPVLQIALFALFLVAVLLFAKFGVADRIAAASEAERIYSQELSQLNALKEYNTDYTEVRDEYSRYSNGYLNEEEKALLDRMEVLSLLEDEIMPYGDVQNINVTGAVLTVTISKVTLNTVSSIVESLQRNEQVAYVTVSTAATGENEDNQQVTANMVIQLQSGGGQ